MSTYDITILNCKTFVSFAEMGNSSSSSYQKVERVLWMDDEGWRIFKVCENYSLLKATGTEYQEVFDKLRQLCRENGVAQPVKHEGTGRWHCGILTPDFNYTGCCCLEPQSYYNEVLWYQREDTIYVTVFYLPL